MKEFVGESPQKLSKFLARVYPALSYSAFRKLLRKRDIKVDGARVGEDCTVGPGSVVQVYYDARPPVPVLFEDENLLVADKPRGIVAEEIAALFREEGKEIIPVHRLDRNTRGILLFAKNAAAEKALTDGFRARAFEKYYRARVYGVPAKRRACLTAYLVKDAARGFVKIYDEKVPGRRGDPHRIRAGAGQRGRDIHPSGASSYGKDAPDPRASGAYRALYRGGRKVRQGGNQPPVRGKIAGACGSAAGAALPARFPAVSI